MVPLIIKKLTGIIDKMTKLRISINNFFFYMFGGGGKLWWGGAAT